MNYNQCPRCQGNWIKRNNDKDKEYCQNCPLIKRNRYGHNGIYFSYSILDFLEYGDRLYWFLIPVDNECSYFNNKHNAIYLPFLPFDITPQTFKTLLVFS
jgi:hypothetical protein